MMAIAARMAILLGEGASSPLGVGEALILHVEARRAIIAA
jgi:hypothetical protein